MRPLLLVVSSLALVSLLIAQPKAPPIENEFVRVVMATDQPATKPGPLHEHKQNRVMIYLDSGDIQIKHADGRIENQHWKAGDIAWSPASGMHTSQNVSSKPVRIVEIELRNTGGGAAKAVPSAILDNAQTLVYRAEKPRGRNFVAVSEKAAAVAWNKLPDGPGPYIFVEVK